MACCGAGSYCHTLQRCLLIKKKQQRRSTLSLSQDRFQDVCSEETFARAFCVSIFLEAFSRKPGPNSWSSLLSYVSVARPFKLEFILIFLLSRFIASDVLPRRIRARWVSSSASFLETSARDWSSLPKDTSNRDSCNL